MDETPTEIQPMLNERGFSGLYKRTSKWIKKNPVKKIGVALLVGAGAYTAYALYRNGQTNDQIADSQNLINTAQDQYNLIEIRVQGITAKVNEALKEEGIANQSFGVAKEKAAELKTVWENARSIVVEKGDSIWSIITDLYEKVYNKLPCNSQTTEFVAEASELSRRLTPAQIAEHFPENAYPCGDYLEAIKDCAGNNINSHFIRPGDKINASTVVESTRMYADMGVENAQDVLTNAQKIRETVLQDAYNLKQKVGYQGGVINTLTSTLSNLKNQIVSYTPAAVAAVIGGITTIIGGSLGKKKDTNGKEPTPTPQGGDNGQGDDDSSVVSQDDSAQNTPKDDTTADDNVPDTTEPQDRLKSYSGSQNVGSINYTKRKEQYNTQKTNRTGLINTQSDGLESITTKEENPIGSSERTNNIVSLVNYRESKSLNYIREKATNNDYKALTKRGEISEAYLGYMAENGKHITQRSERKAQRMEEAYILKYEDNMSAREIAKQLGVTSSTIYRYFTEMSDMANDNSLRFKNMSQGIEKYLPATPAANTTNIVQLGDNLDLRKRA